MPSEPRMSIGWKTQRQNASARQQRRQSLRRPPIRHATATLRSYTARSKNGSPGGGVNRLKQKGKGLRWGAARGGAGKAGREGWLPASLVCMRVLRQVV